MRRRAVGLRGATEFASLKESFNIPIVAGQLNYYNTITLGDLGLIRAPAVAKEYQFYRIIKVEMVIQPKYDTYPAGAGAQLPQIYWMINKGNELPPGLTFQTIQNLGAKPKILNEANRRFAFAPAALVAAANTAAGVALPAQYKISPWLNTRGTSINGVSEIEHSGCVYGVTLLNPGDTTQYNVQVTYHFQFKKPGYPSNPQADTAHNMIYDPVTSSMVSMTNQTVNT